MSIVEHPTAGWSGSLDDIDGGPVLFTDGAAEVDDEHALRALRALGYTVDGITTTVSFDGSVAGAAPEYVQDAPPPSPGP